MPLSEYEAWLSRRYGSEEAYEWQNSVGKDDIRRKGRLMDIKLDVYDVAKKEYGEEDLEVYEAAKALESAMADLRASIWDALTDGLPVEVHIFKGLPLCVCDEDGEVE